MKITLNNGTVLIPYVVAGGKRHVHGFNRDALSFIFPAEVDIVTLDGLFTPANCENILIEDDEGNAFIHSGYTVRAELSKTSVEVVREDAEDPAVFEDRITVVMAQRTYAESQLASLTDTVDVLVMESLMG